MHAPHTHTHHPIITHLCTRRLQLTPPQRDEGKLRYTQTEAKVRLTSTRLDVELSSTGQAFDSSLAGAVARKSYIRARVDGERKAQERGGGRGADRTSEKSVNYICLCDYWRPRSHCVYRFVGISWTVLFAGKASACTSTWLEG